MTVTQFRWKFVCVWCNLVVQQAPKEKHVNPKVAPLPPVDMTCWITSALLDFRAQQVDWKFH